MNRFRRMIITSIALAIPLLHGCAGPRMLGDTHTAASQHNMKIQTVNHDAGNDLPPRLALDGQKAEQVIQSYRREKSATGKTRLISGISN